MAEIVSRKAEKRGIERKTIGIKLIAFVIAAFVNAAFVNVVQYISVRKIRIRKICAACPVRVDIKKSGNNKAAVRIERFAFAIRCTGIVASAQCSYCAVKLDTTRLQSAGEQQRSILDKKTFHYIKY